jgi:hypothetical protein
MDTTMTRKIIQITSHSSREVSHYGDSGEEIHAFFENIIALCDDGSLWLIEQNNAGTYWQHKWDMLPPVPPEGEWDLRSGL